MAQSEMTVVELREWMRGWVCRATGLDISTVSYTHLTLPTILRV